MATRVFTVWLHDDITGELKVMRFMAKNRKDARDIAFARTSCNWVIDDIKKT